MPYESVSQLEQKLMMTKRQMAATKRELDRVAENMRKMKQREHIAKLIKAGRVLEDAGILDQYNENDLYLFVVMYKDFICHKKTLDEDLVEKSPGFNFMSE